MRALCTVSTRSLVLSVFALSMGLGACSCDSQGTDAGSSDLGGARDAGATSDGSAGDVPSGLDRASGADSTAGADAASGSDAGAGGLTVYDLQNPSSPAHPSSGTSVTLEGVVVSGVDLRPTTTGFWVQEPGGGQYSGIFVYAYLDNTHIPLDTLQRGDVVTVSGSYEEYFDLSEITLNGGSVTGTATPPTPATPSGIESDAEPWEGVLVRFDGPCTVTTVRPEFGIVETSCFLLDDDIYQYALTEGQQLSHVTGLITYGFEEYKLLPRDPADLGGASSLDGGVSGDGGGSGNCGSLTYQGECAGDTVRYCYEGTVVEESCTTEFGADATCGLLDCTDEDCQGYYCQAKPGTSCDELSCDLSHGCRGGLCTSSESCDESYVSSCDGETLSSCNPYSNLINELVCNSDGTTSYPYTCSANSSGAFECLGTAGTDNCDLGQSPPWECAPGFVCSSSSGLGDCAPAGDGGVVEDGGAREDGGAVEDGGAAGDGGVVEDGGLVEDSGASEDVVSVSDATGQDLS